YLVGHLISSINYLTLKYFVWLHKRIKAKKSWYAKSFLRINEYIFYRHRIAYQIVKYWKSDRIDKSFTTTEEFWILCAKLQKANQYAPAEYWSVLNDLFKAVSLVFLINSIVATIYHQWTLLIVFVGLTIFSFFRAIQYAEFFIQSVCRLSKP
ncbi:MAG: hypothetical protein ACYC25_12805, partial [Paludibacter sp.]